MSLLPQFLIRDKDNGWYRDHSNGYTNHAFFAGLFSQEEAMQIEISSEGACVAYLASDLGANYSELASQVKRNIAAMGLAKE